MMILKEEIDQIIERRKEKIPAIRESFNNVQKITDEIMKVQELQREMLDNSERLGISEEVREKIEELDICKYLDAFKQLKTEYDSVITRFDKNEINISVVGIARQGKSQLLQSICGLDNYTIPAFVSDDCTGTTSVIKNNPEEKTVSAEINFMTEMEMVECVQKYLDTIFGRGNERIASFNGIGTLNLAELKGKIEENSPLYTKFEHLEKYVKHFDEWKEMVKKGSIIVRDKKEIQKYVAQHNGKEEGTPERENYYYYLAVKNVTISCEFNNPDVGKIVLRDTIGLGDTSLGIEEKMFEAIGKHSDAAIIVRRPETGTGKFDNNDDTLYKKLFEHFKKRNMDKWLFWLINQTGKESVHGDNESRCKAFEKKIAEKNWKIADHLIVNVADKSSVNDAFENKILKKLIENIDAIDDGILNGIRKQTQILYDMYIQIQHAIEAVLISESSKEVDKVEFLDSRWKPFYEKILMKSLKTYSEKLKEERDAECNEFRESIEKILKEAKKLVPSVERLQDDLESGGRNRPFEVYSHHLDKMRNDFTKNFLNIDELIFDTQVKEFKENIINIFAEDNGGRLKYVVPFDEDDRILWLKDVADSLFDKSRYSQFNTAFMMIYQFELSVRGFLMHRIRSRIDRLVGTGYEPRETSTADIALEIHRALERKIKDVCEEIRDEMSEEGFYKDPNRIFYAVLAEFYDRVNYSYTETDFQDVEDAWKSLYREHCNEIWRTEYQECYDMSELYNKWSDLVKQLKKNEKKDFELILN